MTFLRNACATTLLFSLSIFSIPASADEYGTATDTTYPYVIFSGVDIAKDAYEGYLGGMIALNGNLDSNGFLLRVLGSRGWFEDNDAIPNVDGDYWQGDVMMGYQLVRDGVTYAALVGVDFRDYQLSPDDPTSKLRGSETGFKAALDIETERYQKSPFYAALRGSYSTAFDTYYALGRLGFNIDRFAIGPEVWALGDESGDAARVGGFILTDISLGGPSVGTLSFSGGYQFVDNADDPNGDNFGQEGAYATVKFTMAFGESRSESLK